MSKCHNCYLYKHGCDPTPKQLAEPESACPDYDPMDLPLALAEDLGLIDPGDDDLPPPE